jgi:hypothetical protein
MRGWLCPHSVDQYLKGPCEHCEASFKRGVKLSILLLVGYLTLVTWTIILFLR